MLTEEMDSTDTGLLVEATTLIKEINKALDKFELTQLLSGPYDKEGIIVTISAGAGGTDAQVFICRVSKQTNRWYHVLALSCLIRFV